MKEAADTDFRKAAILMLTGMAIIGLIDNFVVSLAEHGGLWQFHALRASMAIPMLIVLAKLSGSRILPRRVVPVLWRSAFLAVAMLIYFGSIPLMPISVVVACLFTSPVFVLIFSVLFYGERIGWVRIIAVASGFAGVILILDPGKSFSLAMVLPVLAGALYAMNAIVARRYCAQEDTISMLVAFFGMLGVFGVIGLAFLDGDMSASFPLRGWVEITQPLLFWTFVQAVGSIIAVGFLTYAYQGSDTTYLVTFEYSLLLFASFWAYVIYGQGLNLQAAIGVFLIISSGVIIALRSPSPSGQPVSECSLNPSAQ